MFEIAEQIEFKNIAKSLNDKRVMFVIGAGMSIESEVPTFLYVVKELLRRQFVQQNLSKEKIENLSTKFNPEAIIAWYIACKPQNRSEEELREELTTILSDEYYKKNEGHDVLRYFFANGLLNKIYTTNFEFFLEKCFDCAGKSVTDGNIDKLTEITKDNIAIIHLHGHLRETLHITEETTFSIETACFEDFIHNFRDNDYVIFIGHSFNDHDIKHAVFQSREKAKNRKMKIPNFIAIGKVDDPAEKAMAEGVWKARGFTFFSCGATIFLQELKNTLIYAKHEKALSLLTTQMNTSIPVIRGIAENMEQTFEYFQEGDGIRYLVRTFLGWELHEPVRD